MPRSSPGPSERAAAPPREPPLYRPFALLAFTATLLVGTPVGAWLLAWRFLGGPAVPITWVLLHGHVQVFGFFGALIVGVAHHLLPRFTGRAVQRGPLTHWLAAGLGAALVLRAAGTVLSSPAIVLVAALFEVATFAALARWVWCALDPPPLGLVRMQLTASSGWLAVGCLVEVLAWGEALATGRPMPNLIAARASASIGELGGVAGWIVGVLLRAGSMFVPYWRVPPRLAQALPWTLGLAVVIAAAGETMTAGGSTALPRLGELLAVSAVAAVVVSGGAFRRHPRAVPMLSRGAEEARLFRVAAVSAVAAALAAVATLVACLIGVPAGALADVARHLTTIGFMTGIVVAMVFRLIPVLERVALPWPRLRSVAFYALTFAVILRAAEVAADVEPAVVGALVVLSGPAAWIGIASAAANLVRVVTVQAKAI